MKAKQSRPARGARVGKSSDDGGNFGAARKRKDSGMPTQATLPALDPDDPSLEITDAELMRSPQRLLDRAYGDILAALGEMGYDISDDNFRDTGPRAARGFAELVRPVSEIDAAVEALLAKSFTARYDEMVISKQNVCFGLCPHHLLPVIYRVSIAYLPSKKVLGISKLSRLARLLARRPVLQEELTQDLSEVLYTRLASRGSAAYVEGLHLCMAARGSEAHEARVVTSAVRGTFRDQPATRQEFLKLVTSQPTPLL